MKPRKNLPPLGLGAAVYFLHHKGIARGKIVHASDPKHWVYTVETNVRTALDRRHVSAIREKIWGMGELADLAERLRHEIKVANRMLASVLRAAEKEGTEIPTPPTADGSPPLKMAEIQRQAVEEALRRCGGDKPTAAKQLGVSVKTIYNWLAEAEEAKR
ncbi:helix-turn-helix domain-containing protein [Blastopirellula retiformator]|uniref:Bacterial regulatory protein, Fis family n=1 Tax=Blastopirellula retiformator TaxID=2527970 RepID=A0A5C5VLM1_9BACT|nr:helix-turn-helix domain-containing protein [Blastopirellula retiformator]TWT38699.1 Bacterial regulatory protein, Fis family [Blastopirellula retiformator]